MKRYTSIYKAAFLPLVLTLLFVSCENLINPPSGDKALSSLQTGKASVSFTVSNEQARTVLPEVNLGELSYILTGKLDGTEKLNTTISGNGATLSLDAGIWSFKLNALKGEDIVLTGGAAPVTLKADESAGVEFTLRPLKEGDGAVNIRFEYPANAGITKVVIGGDITDTINLTPGSGTWNYVEDIAWGDYFATFTFYRGEEAAAVVSEIIQVRNGLTSKKTIDIAIGDTEPAGDTLAEKLQWIADHAVSGANYLVEVTSDEAISPQELRYGGYPGKTGISITLIGIDEERTISLSGTGTMFSVGSDVTLTLENNITLKGRPDNTDSLVFIAGNLVLNDGAKISGNNANFGGGVLADRYSTFTMNGGEISGNTANFGGGVSIEGAFIMNGGKINGNIAAVNGGGVAVQGTFTMNGGEISGNTAASESGYGYGGGGGVYVESTCVFSKTGGVIYGNDGTLLANNAAAGRGHAVYWDTLPLYRDSTLNTGDNISTANTSVGWESIARPEAAALAVDQWISGPITAGGEKWFKFTASDANQYIHSKGGGTWQLIIDVYDSALQPVGGRFGNGEEDINNWNHWSVSGINPGQTYYVRIWSPIYPPGYPGYSGNYEIMLTKSPIPKGAVVTPLSEGWNNGSFAAGKDEWFSFIANAAIPYLHFNSDALNEFKFRVYDSTGQLVNYSSSSWDDRSYTILYGLSPGQTYSLNVSSGPENSGEYKIALNQSPLPPGIVATSLVPGWNDGSITAGGEEWFKFTANADPQQYIGIMSAAHNEISVELYNSDWQKFSCWSFPVDDTTSIWSVSGLSSGQPYYIRISSDTYSGDYQIGVSEPDPPSP